MHLLTILSAVLVPIMGMMLQCAVDNVPRAGEPLLTSSKVSTNKACG